VPYQNIVFLKNGGAYNAEIRVDIEITDTNSNFITREIKDWKISTGSFEQTNSAEIFAEGLVNLKLPEGVYYVQPIINDQNSKREFKLKKERLEVKDDINIEPLIVYSDKNSCGEEEFFRLTNFEGNIPFGSDIHNIIIPVSDISVKEINITILSSEDTVTKKTLKESFISSIGLNECSGKILVANNNSIKTRNFLLNGITKSLREGPFTLIINDTSERKFNSFVSWYNKPKSLRNPDLAVKSLKHLDEDRLVDSLLDIDDEEQYRALIDYWKKMDPSAETEYNELMAEYYTRVDYAQNNFSSLTGTKGIDTDRGMIYIKFGKPDQVERASNEKGKIVETWIYTKPQRKFVFVDKQGVGVFSLESS
jgi:GWxTD domain-containing protein